MDEYVNQYDNELGPPWKNMDKWIKLSYPFFHADRIKTPTLFMAAEKDFNVPSVGAEQMYQALHSNGIPTELNNLSRPASWNKHTQLPGGSVYTVLAMVCEILK